MAVEIDLIYQGRLRCQATHGPSGNILVTDAPRDNHGRGEAFSPTDLVATGLGACMLTMMGLTAERYKLDISGARATVIKEMASQPRRRIAKLTVHVTLPKGHALSEDDLTRLTRAIDNCPVQASIHPDIELMIQIE